MKSRLSSTIWLLTIFNGVALFTVLGLAYSAGRQASAGSGFEPSGLIIPAIIALSMCVILAWRLTAAFISPVNELSEFSERLAAGDAKARADVGTFHLDFNVEVGHGFLDHAGVAFHVAGISFILLLVKQLNAWEFPVRIAGERESAVVLASAQLLGGVFQVG